MPSAISKAFAVALAFGAAGAFPHPKAPTPRAEVQTDNSELIAKLKTDATAIKQFQRLLTKDGQELISGEDLARATVWDFNEGGVPTAGTNGGTVSSSNIESFPILVGTGLIMNYATLGPCGLFTPHVHPRANEYFVVVEGEVDFSYTLEIGLLNTQTPNPPINGKLTKYTGTLFPQGSIHYQVNNSPDCKPAAIFATLSSEDPGTTPILQMPPAGNVTVAPRKVDGEDFESVRALLPPQIVSVVDKCLARCSSAKA